MPRYRSLKENPNQPGLCDAGCGQMIQHQHEHCDKYHCGSPICIEILDTECVNKCRERQKQARIYN